MKFCFQTVVTLAVSGLMLFATTAYSADFPNRDIEVINNSKPGGGSDIFLRFATEKAAETLGVAFIHKTKKGGVATNTLKYVSGKPADGHTLFIVNAGTALTMMRGTVELTKDDVVPLVRGTIDPEFIVVKAGRFSSAADFVDFARNNTVKQAGTKVGGNPHVSALIMRDAIGMKNQVYVPFEKSGAIAINVINGHVDVMKGTPEPIIDKLEKTLLESMNSKGYLEYLAGSGQTAASIAGREEFTAQFEAMYQGYQAVAKDLVKK